MAVFYSDNPTLSLATAIYTDAALTTKAADGYYSDQTISRRQDGGFLLAAEACANCSANPATSTLTFSAYDGGTYPGAKFYFMLSNPLVTNDITIENAQIDAFDSTDCLSFTTATDFLAAPLVLLAGTNNANGLGGGLDCALTGVVRYKRFNSLTVNGTSVFNGSIIDIGGCLVTIVINSTTCETLSCN
jgi:hypothetical protein